MKLNKVAFPRRGKGAVGTYESQVVGTPSYNQDGTFDALEYDNLPSRPELLALLEAEGIDSVEALARGRDIIRRSLDSGGSSLASIIFRKLVNADICIEMKDATEKGKKLRAYAATIMGMKRSFPKMTIEQVFDLFVDNLVGSDSDESLEVEETV